MPFVWKPLPGTTGIESPPKDSVIVNQKEGWKLDELEKFGVALESLKAELKQEGVGPQSKDGVKRINHLAKNFTKDTYYYLNKGDKLYYPVDQEKDKCSWLRFAFSQYFKANRYRGCHLDKSCSKHPIIQQVKGHDTTTCCRVHAEECADAMQNASLLLHNLEKVYFEEYDEKFEIKEGVYFSINPLYKEDPDHDYEEERIISISFVNQQMENWGDIHPCFVLPITDFFKMKDGAEIIDGDPTEDELFDFWSCLSLSSTIIELRPDAHDMIDKMRLQHNAVCVDAIERTRKRRAGSKAKAYAKGDAKPLDEDELEDSKDTGIKAIQMTDQTNDLVGSSKCAVDENGKVLNREPIRKMLYRHTVFMVDEHGHPLNLKDITIVEVSSIEDLQTAYDAHNYETDGPAIFILRTSRDTDQDSAWLVERSHQGYCTKNKITNHIEGNHWKKGNGSSYPYSVATVTIYKDFLRAARDPEKTHRLNRSSFPALKKRMWIHQTSNPNHWEAEATGAREKYLNKKTERYEMKKERKRKLVEMEK